MGSHRGTILGFCLVLSKFLCTNLIGKQVKLAMRDRHRAKAGMAGRGRRATSEAERDGRASPSSCSRAPAGRPRKPCSISVCSWSTRNTCAHSRRSWSAPPSSSRGCESCCTGRRLGKAKPRRGRPSHRCLLPTKLRPEHRVEGFDCGQSALNDWLGRYALPNQQASPTTCSAGRAACQGKLEMSGGWAR